MTSQEWDLLHIMSPYSGTKFALVLLNQPLGYKTDIFFQLWRKAVFKATVDGGTNRLYDSTEENREDFLPNLISGDLDSARPEVLKFYQERGVELEETKDQDFTDFHKCIDIVIRKKIHLQVDCVIAFGAFGGRLDQEFANINTLFMHHSNLSVPFYLMDSLQIGCLLQKGSHKLKVDSGYEGKYCGLIPVAGKCECVTTTGLKWNLDHQPSCFGGLISTSNTWNGDKLVTIETDAPLFWTMTIGNGD